MLNLIFAPSADMLAPLAKDRILGAWRDPFDPPTVIVPNPTVGKWLSVRLAEDPAFGCVANARMLTLERFLWNTLGPDQDTLLINAGHISQIICALLDEIVLENDVYKPLRDYLYVPTSNVRNVRNNVISYNRSIDPIKRVQLSARIARQFLEYEYNRPSVWSEEALGWRSHGIDAKWLSGKKYFEGHDHETWQMDLYRRVHECFSKSVSPRYTTLPHLYRYKREGCAKHKRPWCDVGSNSQIIIVGVSKISHFHRNTLVEISQCAGVDMHVFLTNPCAEFWEDVDTSRRTRAPRRRWSNDSPDEAAGIKPVKPEDYNKPKLDMFEDEEDHALLKLWGAAGKENIFLWCPQAQWNFEYHGGEVDGGIDIDIDAKNISGDRETTLLKAIQQSLLSRNNALNFINPSISPTTTQENNAKDRSLQILACPDLSREVEEVRELILDMAHDNVIDCFDDIAVYIPDPNRYVPYIQRVFGAYPQGHSEYIPFTVIGASCGSSLVARAFSALLGVAAGEFNRAMIFELLDNPVVSASRGFSRGDLERWEEWAETFGMFRGYNAEQRRLMGDKGDAVMDEHTFERGMRRVLEASADMCDARNEQSAEGFLSLLKELNELSAYFSGVDGLFDIRDVAETVRRAVWAWMGRIDGGSADEAAETRVRREILNSITLMEMQHTCAGRTDISKDEFLTLARDCVAVELPSPPTARRGVTFAPLRASMVLPHRAIFVMGLGAAEFPGTNETPGWDLLSSKRIVGDSDTVRDNRFAFLELLHAAKRRLILSYRARDMQKDEALQPSSVVLELEEYLIGQGVADCSVNSRKCSVRREVPWVVHEALAAARAVGRLHGTWDNEQRALAAESLKERVKHRHDLTVNTHLPINDGRTYNRDSSVNPDIKLSANADSSTKTVEHWDLKLFLANPLEYHLSRTLGIRNDEDTGDTDATDEPLDSGYVMYALRKKLWNAVLNIIFPEKSDDTDVNADADDDIKEISTMAKNEADEIYEAHVNSGQAPEGHICRMERENLIKSAAKYAKAAIDLRTACFPNHKFVEQYGFTVACGDVLINARNTAIIPRDAAGQHKEIGVIAFDKAGKPADNLNLWLDGLLLWLNMMKNGDARGPIDLIAINHGDDPKISKPSSMSMDSGKLPEADKWLTDVLTQMLIEKRNEHLPFSVIAEITKAAKKNPERFEERLQKLTVGSLMEQLVGYKSYTEAFDLADAKPPVMDDDELRLTVKNRYELMLGETGI